MNNVNILDLQEAKNQDLKTQMNIFSSEIENQAAIELTELGSQIMPILNFDLNNIKSKKEKIFYKKYIKENQLNIIRNFLNNTIIDVTLNNKKVGTININKKYDKEKIIDAEIIKEGTNITVLIVGTENLYEVFKKELKESFKNSLFEYFFPEEVEEVSEITEDDIKFIDLEIEKNHQETELIKNYQTITGKTQLSFEEIEKIKELVKKELILNLKIKIIKEINTEIYRTTPYIYNILKELEQTYKIISMGKPNKNNKISDFLRK